MPSLRPSAVDARTLFERNRASIFSARAWTCRVDLPFIMTKYSVKVVSPRTSRITSSSALVSSAACAQICARSWPFLFLNSFFICFIDIMFVVYSDCSPAAVCLETGCVASNTGSYQPNFSFWDQQLASIVPRLFVESAPCLRQVSVNAEFIDCKIQAFSFLSFFGFPRRKFKFDCTIFLQKQIGVKRFFPF